MKRWMAKWFPPGVDGARQIMIGTTILLLSAAVGVVAFAHRLYKTADYLNDNVGDIFNDNQILILHDDRGEYFRWFGDFTAGCYIGFSVLFVWCVILAIRNYRRFHGESQSIYLMKRLCDPWERHKRCLGLPVAFILLGFLTLMILLWVNWRMYAAFPPEQRLSGSIEFEIWRVLTPYFDDWGGLIL